MKQLKQYRPAFLLMLCVLVVTPMIWANVSYLDTGLTIATTALIAISAGLCYGEAGILSVAQAAFAALGAYATAILTTNYGWPTLAGLAAAILVPMALAYPLALLVIRLSALALALATIMISEIIYQLLAAGGSFTGGFVGLSGIPLLPFSSPVETFLFSWLLVVIAVIGLIHIRNSTQGRALRVMQTDPLLAQSLGIPVTRRLAGLFAVAAGIAGTAGWLYAHTRGFLAPESLSLNLSITVLMMAIIGGKKHVLGAVLGAVILIMVFEFVPSAQSQGMFYGTVLVLALIFFPGGILGTSFRTLRTSLLGRQRPRVPRGSTPEQVQLADRTRDDTSAYSEDLR